MLITMLEDDGDEYLQEQESNSRGMVAGQQVDKRHVMYDEGRRFGWTRMEKLRGKRKGRETCGEWGTT